VTPRPQPDRSDLRPLDVHDIPAVAASLARAFANNPGMGWALRDPRTRPVRMRRNFETLLRHLWQPAGGCVTTNDREAAALWMPPGTWHIGLADQLRLLPRLIGAVRGDVGRVLRWSAIAERKHPTEPHWYLAVLGVDPSLQGRGFGSHLMAPTLERCDSEGLPAYLETDTERNVALYERHGFKVTERFNLPGGGDPPIWLMWRDPA
jgi:ribosomal protein S18 acetylase RimI-like enzyme